MPENVYRSPHPILWLFPLSPCHSLLTRAIPLLSENDTEHPLILPLYFIYPSFSSLRPQPLLFLHDGRLGVLRPLLPPQGSFLRVRRSLPFLQNLRGPFSTILFRRIYFSVFWRCIDDSLCILSCLRDA